jgi:RNA polymerase sigma-70 factor (ECF subfamily)
MLGKEALTRSFLAAVSAAPEEALEAFVAGYASAASRWPGVEVEPDVIVRSALINGVEALCTVEWEDLFLACACRSGHPRAIAIFDAEILGQVARHVAAIDGSQAFADEVRQRLREKMLAPPAAQIARYAGRGPLGGWVRVAAMRTALNLRRERVRADRREQIAGEDLIPVAGDPELEMLRMRYANDVKEAFTATLASLTTDERNVIRMHYLDGLSIDDIGTAYGVHRATAARWIQNARARILEETERRLRDRLHGTPSEIASVIGLVQGAFEASVSRLLG